MKVNAIYQALHDNANMSSGSSSASLYINSSEANRGWYVAGAGYIGNPNAMGEFKVERANDKDLADEIYKQAGTKFTNSIDTTGGRANGNRNVDRIGDGTIIEAFLNEATNHVDVCVISVYGGKVDAVKGATTKKDAYVIISVNNNAFPDRYPDTINESGNREFETEEFDEDDVVAFTYSDSAAEIKSMYLMESESGTLQSRVTGKSLRLDDTTYSYGKEYTFDDLTEDRLGTKSSYIVYLDENDYVLWIEEDEFSVDDYVLVERITIETTVNNVTTKTASVLGAAETNPGYTGPNSDALQKAYNQSKDAVGNSSWDAQAQVRYSNGTRRTVTLDDSKNYRTSSASDATVQVSTIMDTATNTTTDVIQKFENGVWTNKGVAGTVDIVAGTSGDDGNWIAEPFTAGHIVRISSNSNGYRLHSINANRFLRISDASLTGNKLYFNGARVAIDLDSETHFVVEDNVQGSYKSYIGVKNAPTVKLVGANQNATAYVYTDGSTAKLVFITNGWDVSNSSNDVVFLVANSTSNLVENDDGSYYEVSAVEKNEIKTLMVKYNPNNPVSFTGTKYNGTRYQFVPGNVKTNGVDTEKEYFCVILNNVKYDSNDFITGGEFKSTDETAVRYHGIRRVNDEEIRVNTFFQNSTLKDVASDVRVYFVDGDDIEEIEYDEIVTDSTDYVYLLEDKDGEVTYIFIVNFDGAGDDGQNTNTQIVYTDGQLEETSNGAATAYTLHVLSSNSAALATVNPETIRQYISSHSAIASTYAPTAGNFQYNAAQSVSPVYVYDWMTNGNASGVQVRITVATDATPQSTNN